MDIQADEHIDREIDGKPASSSGVLHGMAEGLKYHEELVTENSLLKSRVFQLESLLMQSKKAYDLSSEGIFFTDEDYFFTDANPAFSRITGYGRCELLGKSIEAIYGDLDSGEFLLNVKTAVHAIGAWQGEAVTRNRKGATVVQHFMLNAIFDSARKPVRYVGIVRDISDIRRQEAEIAFTANHDPLTGLPNRSSFGSTLCSIINRSDRPDAALAVAVIDLDNYKQINEEFSYEAGDFLLKASADRLSDSLRAGDYIARTGGDKFSVIIPIRRNSDVREVARRILEVFLKPFLVGQNEIYLSASVGIALFPDHGCEGGALIANADLALQSGKQKGKHGYGVFDESMIEMGYARHLMESALRSAIDRRALSVHYQPVVDMDSGRIIGSEALARWDHPEKGMIPPLQFIPIAEESDLIQPLGEYVFRTACTQHSHWVSESISSGKIAINFSSKQFRKPDFLDSIKQIIDETGIEPNRLTIEITESILIEDIEESAKILHELKCLGVNIGIDDFGTGYSSLAYLKSLPIDILKIDQSFVRDMEHNPSDRKIVSAIIAMAHGLNIQVVAEGVETTAQFEFLKSEACDFAQGFLFSKAIPAEEMESLFKAGESCD